MKSVETPRGSAALVAHITDRRGVSRPELFRKVQSRRNGLKLVRVFEI